MQPEEYRQASLKVWEAMAPGWERWRTHLGEALAPVHDWLIRELAPRTGDVVLELASGTGDLGFKVARIIGDEGRLISTDFSPDMVDVARRHGAERVLVAARQGRRNTTAPGSSSELERASSARVISLESLEIYGQPNEALREWIPRVTEGIPFTLHPLHWGGFTRLGGGATAS